MNKQQNKKEEGEGKEKEGKGRTWQNGKLNAKRPSKLNS